MAETYLTSQGDTLDIICWRYYAGRQSGAVEAVLAANPGVADMPIELPLNTRLILPELPASAVESQPIRLWD